jgi:hypothetical protein
VLCVLLLSSAARATDIVQVVIAANQSGEATALRDDLYELFGRIDAIAWYRDARAVDPNELMKPAPGAPPALAHVWIDLAVSKPDQVLVYLADAQRQRVLLRTIKLPHGLDEVVREEISLIVASSVATLRSGAPLNVGRSDDVLLSTPQPPPAPTRITWMTLGASGAAERWSADQTMVPAVSLTTLLGRGSPTRRFQPALWLTVGYHGAETSSQPLALQLRGGSLALVALPGWRVSPRVALRLGLGAGLDLLSVKPVATSPQNPMLQLEPALWSPTLFGRAAGRVDVDLSRTLLVFLAVAAELGITKSRFVVGRQNDTQTVYDPARLRPSVLVGIEGRILGADLP